MKKTYPTINRNGVVRFLFSLFFLLIWCSCEKDMIGEEYKNNELYASFIITARDPEMEKVRLTGLNGYLELDVTYEVAEYLTGFKVEEWRNGNVILTEPTDSQDYLKHEIPEVYQKKNTKYYWMIQNVKVNRTDYVARTISNNAKTFKSYMEEDEELALSRKPEKTNLTSIIANTTVQQYDGFRGIIINWYILPYN